MWGGYVRFGENGKFPVWARARITATMTRVVATENIPAGKPIQKTRFVWKAAKILRSMTPRRAIWMK